MLDPQPSHPLPALSLAGAGEPSRGILPYRCVFIPPPSCCVSGTRRALGGWTGCRKLLVQRGMTPNLQGRLQVPAPTMGPSVSALNLAAAGHLQPLGKAAHELRRGGRRTRGWGPGRTARGGQLRAAPTCPWVLCHPQHGAALQPWRLRPRDPGGQHGQQHRQSPSQGQGVQPASQPGAHRELTAGSARIPVPPWSDDNRKEGRHAGK